MILRVTVLSKRLCLFICTASLACALRAEDFKLSSRNMPRSCEFVVLVDSDIQLQVKGLVQNTQLHVAYINEWNLDSGWQWQNETIAVTPNAQGQSDVAWTLASMRIPENFLYRRARFYLESQPEHIYEAQFGREFGEWCRADGRSSTPFRERQVLPVLEP